MDKEFLEIVGSGKPTGSVQKETTAVSVTISTSVQNQHSRILLRDLLRGRIREMRREPGVPEERVPVVECFDGHARNTSKELAPIHSVKSGILQSACSTSPRMDSDLGKSALVRIVEAVAILKNTRQVGCVFQDMEPPKSLSILRKSSNILKPIRCVEAVVRHANIRDQNPSLGYIFAQVNLIGAAPTLQNLRIGLRRRESGKSKVPAKQRGSWPKMCLN